MKKIKAKSNNKPIILVNLVLIAVLAVVAVYAWFAVNADNNVKMYEIEVHSDNPLQLSFTGKEGTWQDSLNLADLTENGVNVLDTMKFINVSGNGQKFKIPALTQHDNYAEINGSVKAKDAVANKDYLSFDVYMRSKDPVKVYFSSDSKADPVSATLTGTGSGNPCSSAYASGNNAFSKDCIVGALRVAAINYKKGTPEKNFIWIPRPDIHLNNAVNSTTYTMTTDAKISSNSEGTGASGENYKWNNSYEHWYYTESSTGSSVINIASGFGAKLYTGSGSSSTFPNSTDSEPTETDTLLATLSGTPDANGYYVSHAKFNVWIEGCDTEARRALVGGKFNLTIMLDSFNIN